MTRKQKDMIAAGVAGFGILALWFLEGVVTALHTESSWLAAAQIIAFGAAGVARWFLFYEGQQLNDVDPKRAIEIFFAAISISAFVVVYAALLWITNEVDWRTFTILLLLVLTLSVAEHTFAVRIAANVHPDVVEMLERLNEMSDKLNESEAERLRIDAEVIAVQKESERIAKAAEAERLDNARLRDTSIDTLEKLSLAERFAGEVVERKKTYFLFVCGADNKEGAICNRPFMVSNAQRTLCCPDCGYEHTFGQKVNGAKILK